MIEIDISVTFTYDLVNNNFELFRLGLYTQFFGTNNFMVELAETCIEEFNLSESHENTPTVIDIWYTRMTNLF